MLSKRILKKGANTLGRLNREISYCFRGALEKNALAHEEKKSFLFREEVSIVRRDWQASKKKGSHFLQENENQQFRRLYLSLILREKKNHGGVGKRESKGKNSSYREGKKGGRIRLKPGKRSKRGRARPSRKKKRRKGRTLPECAKSARSET